jgi:hypothetical protein
MASWEKFALMQTALSRARAVSRSHHYWKFSIWREMSRSPQALGGGLNSLGADMIGVHKGTTLSRKMKELEEYPGGRVGEISLNTVKTIIEFPNVVFREWRAKSGEYHRRSGDELPWALECQVTAEEEVLHG